jgi:hypothetical protein
MKRRIVLLAFFLMCSILTAFCENIKKTQIEFTNVMEGKSIKYVVTARKIGIYKKISKKRYLLIAFYKISKENEEKICNAIYEIMDSCGTGNITYSSYPSALDGFTWKLTINLGSTSQIIYVCNCFFKNLDDVILILNEEIKGRKKIPLTGRINVNEKCVSR